MMQLVTIQIRKEHFEFFDFLRRHYRAGYSIGLERVSNADIPEDKVWMVKESYVENGHYLQRCQNLEHFEEHFPAFVDLALMLMVSKMNDTMMSQAVGLQKIAAGSSIQYLQRRGAR